MPLCSIFSEIFLKLIVFIYYIIIMLIWGLSPKTIQHFKMQICSNLRNPHIAPFKQLVSHLWVFLHRQPRYFSFSCLLLSSHIQLDNGIFNHVPCFRSVLISILHHRASTRGHTRHQDRSCCEQVFLVGLRSILHSTRLPTWQDEWSACLLAVCDVTAVRGHCFGEHACVSSVVCLITCTDSECAWMCACGSLKETHCQLTRHF